MLSLFFCHTLFLFFFLLLYFFFPPTPPLLPRPVESDNTLRIKNEKTRSLLLFTNVTEKHFGNYTCFASNRLGASNASMLLFRKLSDRTSRQSVHMHARPHLSLFNYQSVCRTVNRCDTLLQNNAYSMTNCFLPFFALSHFFSLHAAQRFFSPLHPPFPHFRYSPPH